MAVIIPADLTAAVFAPGGRATVELYQDPTLTIGPSIVKDVISQFVDSFAGTKITADVVYDQLSVRSMAVDAPVVQTVAMQYADWVSGLGESRLLALRRTRPTNSSKSSAQLWRV